jgi:conjugal transfer pilus assembly protein TraU
MTSLGGVVADPGIETPTPTRHRADNQSATSFYQVHWYADPIAFWLGIIIDHRCMEQSVFDLAYMTEIDPTWNNDEITAVLYPETFLFGNLFARASCAIDCLTANATFPISTFYWCAGCQGSLYPLDGNIQAHIGGVQASSLLIQRMLAKMHRYGITLAGHGKSGFCGLYYEPLVDRSQYKYTMIYPVPQTDKMEDRCCQPLGVTTSIWGAGREIPYWGEDFAYILFRKRNCCKGAF